MSMENAILKLAEAIEKLAAASLPTVRTAIAVVADAKNEELLEAIATGGKAKEQTPAQKAIAEANAAAAAAKAKKEEAKTEPAPVEDKELDYEKDVKPALVQYLKAKGRDAGVALLAKYGAKNGEGVKPEDYAAILADMAG